MKIGDKVIKNSDTWIGSEFDSWEQVKELVKL